MSKETMTMNTHKSIAKRLTLAVAVVAFAVALIAPSAQAAFGIAAFGNEFTANSAGDPYTQAGGHPYAIPSRVAFNTKPDPRWGAVPDREARTVEATLPPGLVGNPTVTPTCSIVEFFGSAAHQCPAASQVGTADVRFLPDFILVGLGLYNLEPSPGAPASFGIDIAGVRVVGDAFVDPANDYRVGVRFEGISQSLWLYNSDLTFWGTPAAHSGSGERLAYLSMPTRCTAPGEGLVTNLKARSWQEPEAWVSTAFEADGTVGCDQVPFEVGIEAVPTERRASTPTGMAVTLTMPQDGLLDPGGIATSHLKSAKVTLPEGMTVNAASASGLGACPESEVGLGSSVPATCPDSSKLGTVEIDTPVLEDPLNGSVFLAKQNENPFGSLLAMYVVAEDPAKGIAIKLPGKVSPDPSTGRLTVSFDDNPQLPFSEMRMRLKDGPRAALVTPAACGTYATQAEFTGWARPDETLSSNSSFTIDQNCGSAFAPGFEAGTLNPTGGQHSPFTMRITRSDGQPNLSSIEATLPKGLLAKLAGVPLCGEAQAASGDCASASQIGTVTVGAGAGPAPVYVPEPGKAPTALYLAGPYKGAPLSLVAKVPAQAGPFDLGIVVVRNALRIDPVSAHVTAISDPLPQILQGIPIAYRDIRVEVSRSGFTLNPTSCNPMRVESLLTASGGGSASPFSPFQAANCERLGFKPKLALKLSGKTHRSAHPALRATLTMPKGGANIARAQVTLPKQQILEQSHIRTICTRVQYAAKACPKASVYGYAKAWSPLLDKPLEGPVYLRSSSNELPDLVASLDGQIHIDLAGRIDSVDARIRNTFDLVPDAPVSKFVLTMQGGRKGLLVNNTELCKAKPRADVKFDGQNGKTADSQPLVKVGCGKPKSRK